MLTDEIRTILWNELQSSKAVDRLLGSLAAAGYAIVPVEPTEAMTKVGTEARWRSAVRDADSVREIYRAMLVAAKGEKK